MKRMQLLVVWIVPLLAISGCVRAPVEPPVREIIPEYAARGTRFAVATVHPLASRAAMDAFDRGGNAVDAAVAAALTLGVVDGHNSGLGGGCFMLIRRADGTILAIDGREIAPAAAKPDMYLRQGQPVESLSKTGVLAIGVPGSLAAYDHAMRTAGRLALADLLLPAADLADSGFEIDSVYASRLREAAEDLAKFKTSAMIFLDGEGRPRREGYLLRQPDLARSYRAIARGGIEWFYGGAFAAGVEQYMRANGGILTAADFKEYELRLREPLVSGYRGYTIVGFPPPSSGGVHVAQILNILANFTPPPPGAKSPKGRSAPILWPHVLTEAMKLAFADRAYWLGDPDFVDVPADLISMDYARTLAARIDLTCATPVTGHGMPPGAESGHTTHIATADAEGNVVALTTTLNTPFGSKVVIPGTGILMNNQMDDFSIHPWIPNAFGLVGAQANSIAPRKRPLSSMAPTIVLRDNRPIMTLGAAGGPTIISQVVQAISGVVDRGDALPTAISAARIHHQWQPDVLSIEDKTSPQLQSSLEAMGHRLERRRGIGACQAIGMDDSGFIAVHDPRIPGSAMAR